MINLKQDLRRFSPNIKFKRIKNAGEPMAKIIPDIATFISSSQSVGNLCELVKPRGSKSVELSEEAIQQHIDWITSRANYSSDPFILSDGNHSENGVSLSIDIGCHTNLEKLWIKSNQKFSAGGIPFPQMIDFFSVIGQSFDAFVGYLYNDAIATFNNGKYLPAHEFDSSRIPQCISWINYWSQEQVESVGRDRAMNAGWFEVVELPNRAIVTVATQDYSDLIGNSTHLECFEKISNALNLRELQEQSNPSKVFQMDSW
jgi:hypothetical protein